MKASEGILKEVSSLGVMICRLQVPGLTDSHQKMIRTIYSRHSRMIIFLGTTGEKISSKNPFPFEFRKQMVNLFISSHVGMSLDAVTIIPLPDNQDNDVWVANLDRTISAFLSFDESAHLYGGRDSFIPYYEQSNGKFKTTALEQEDYDSGTELRKITSVFQPYYTVQAAQAILWAIRQLEEK